MLSDPPRPDKSLFPLFSDKSLRSIANRLFTFLHLPDDSLILRGSFACCNSRHFPLSDRQWT